MFVSTNDTIYCELLSSRAGYIIILVGYLCDFCAMVPYRINWQQWQCLDLKSHLSIYAPIQTEGHNRYSCIFLCLMCLNSLKMADNHLYSSNVNINIYTSERM